MTDDLQELESLLARSRPAAPPPEARQRIVLAAQQQRRWRQIEAVSALALIGLQLITLAASWSPAPRPRTAAAPQTISASLAELNLPLPPEQTAALANHLAASAMVEPLPELHGIKDTPSPTGGLQ